MRIGHVIVHSVASKNLMLSVAFGDMAQKLRSTGLAEEAHTKTGRESSTNTLFTFHTPTDSSNRGTAI